MGARTWAQAPAHRRRHRRRQRRVIGQRAHSVISERKREEGDGFTRAPRTQGDAIYSDEDDMGLPVRRRGLQTTWTLTALRTRIGNEAHRNPQTPLGAGQEVGRSCILLRFKGRTIMVRAARRARGAGTGAHWPSVGVCVCVCVGVPRECGLAGLRNAPGIQRHPGPAVL